MPLNWIPSTHVPHKQALSPNHWMATLSLWMQRQKHLSSSLTSLSSSLQQTLRLCPQKISRIPLLLTTCTATFQSNHRFFPALLCAPPSSIIGPFQPILNTSARVILSKSKSYHLTLPFKTFQWLPLTQNKSKIFPRTAWANMNWPLVTSLYSSPGPPCDLVPWAQMLLPQDPCTCCPLCQGLSCPMSTGVVSLLPPHPLFSLCIHIVPLQSGCIYMVALISLNTLLPFPFHFSPQHSSADTLYGYLLVHRLSLPVGQEFHEGGEFCQFCSLGHPPGTVPNAWQQALALNSWVSVWINEWMKGQGLPSFLTKPHR